VLHYQRKRQKELAEREAAGENVWSTTFPPLAVTRLMASWSAIFGNGFWSVASNALKHVTIATGHDLFAKYGYTESHSLEVFDLGLRNEPALAPSLIEAFAAASYQHPDVIATLNTLLAQERVAFEFIDGQMIEFESKELHQEIVAPTLRLLSGRTGWDAVETAYQNALREIGQDPADAITDAGTALQEAFTILGCKGNALGPLADDARKIGLLAPYDGKIIDWVSADRSGKGDAHNATPAGRDDAWLAVHVVGALILRLAGGASRVE
jgi:hypothetical protein